MITVPFWLLGLGIATIVLLIVLVWAVWNNWFPPADRGSFIYTFEGDMQREAAVSLLDRVVGKQPRFVANGLFARRYMYPSGAIFTIPNGETTPAPILEKQCGYAVVTKDPASAANEARQLLEGAGWKVEVFHDPDQQIGEGKMSFLVCNAFPFALIFRKPFHKMGPMPPRWDGAS
jgi:hypothetical protein